MLTQIHPAFLAPAMSVSDERLLEEAAAEGLRQWLNTKLLGQKNVSPVEDFGQGFANPGVICGLLNAVKPGVLGLENCMVFVDYIS